ncbi:MAG: DUF1847 domain-containing protein [Methanosarcinaceae archaeon]|nr:DUF1847 domain-containing protein [Methanosarcinaceae archaeon]MDD4496823.1 DUF1847 domain-containing protein [Methanosarcinaceae archaeon]
MQCVLCRNKECLWGKNCSIIKSELEYSEKEKKVLQASSLFQAGTERKTKLEEIVVYAKKMEYSKIGIAFSIECESEARLAYDILSRYFEVFSVCCNVCGFGKEQFGIPKNGTSEFEAACNPRGQALLLNGDRAELNLMLGLDAINEIIFSEKSDAPAVSLPVGELLSLREGRASPVEENTARKHPEFQKKHAVRTKWV